MSGSTSKYVIPYPVLADTVASLAATVQNLAGRVDLLLGESGSYTIASAAANTTHNQPISLARTYPGNTGAAVPGIVIAHNVAGPPTGLGFYYWPNTWLGSATTITGFSLATQWSAAVTSRVVVWRFIPVL